MCRELSGRATLGAGTWFYIAAVYPRLAFKARDRRALVKLSDACPIRAAKAGGGRLPGNVYAAERLSSGHPALGRKVCGMPVGMGEESETLEACHHLCLFCDVTSCR